MQSRKRDRMVLFSWGSEPLFLKELILILDMVDRDLAAALGCPNKAMIIMHLCFACADGHHFFPESKFEGEYYCSDMPEIWCRLLKWISIDEAQTMLSEMCRDEWLIHFRTPTTLYYRPNSEKISNETWRKHES